MLRHFVDEGILVMIREAVATLLAMDLQCVGGLVGPRHGDIKQTRALLLDDLVLYLVFVLLVEVHHRLRLLRGTSL